MGWQVLLATTPVSTPAGFRIGVPEILLVVVVALVVARLFAVRRTRREHEYFEEQAWRLKRSAIRLVRPDRPIWPVVQDNDDPHWDWTLDGEIKAVAARRIGKAGQRGGHRPLDLVPDRHGLFPLRKSEIDSSSD